MCMSAWDSRKATFVCSTCTIINVECTASRDSVKMSRSVKFAPRRTSASERSNNEEKCGDWGRKREDEDESNSKISSCSSRSPFFDFRTPQTRGICRHIRNHHTQYNFSGGCFSLFLILFFSSLQPVPLLPTVSTRYLRTLGIFSLAILSRANRVSWRAIFIFLSRDVLNFFFFIFYSEYKYRRIFRRTWMFKFLCSTLRTLYIFPHQSARTCKHKKYSCTDLSSLNFEKKRRRLGFRLFSPLPLSLSLFLS